MTEDSLGISDWTTGKYSAVADAGNTSMARNEAVALSTRAEFLLEVDGRPEEALNIANQALDAFKKLGDAVAITDSLRLVLEAYRQKADDLKSKNDNSEEAKALFKKIESMANQHLNSARSSGDKRMQAAMLLSLAETNFDRRGKKKRDEAFKVANAAAPLFKQVGDVKLEGLTHLVLSRMFYKYHDVPAAINSAHDGIVAFQTIGYKSGEAQCWHSIGAAHVQAFRVAEALDAGVKALAASKESGNQFLYARESYALAGWCLLKDDSERALPLIEEAYALFNDMSNPKGWHTGALEAYVKALVGVGNASMAVKVAKQAVKVLKKAGQKKGRANAMLCLASAYASDADTDGAEDTLEKAIEIAVELKDKFLEVDIVKAAVQFYVELKRYDDALGMAERVKELYKDLGRTKDEALALMHSITKVHVLAKNNKKSLNSADEALKLVENMGDPQMEGWALLANSAVFANSGELERALKCAEEAAELFQEDGDKMGQAKAFLQSSQIHTAKNDFRAALRCASDSLELQEALGDRSGQSNVLLAMGQVHVANDRPKEAVALFSDGAKVAREVDDQKNMYLNLLAIAEAYGGMIENSGSAGTVAKENATFAIKAAKEAAQFAEAMGDMASEGQAYYWLAALSLVLGKISDMFQAAHAAISLAKQAGSETDQVRGLCMLAKAWIAKGKLAKASGILEDAQELATRIGDTDMERTIVELLKDTEAAAETVVVVASSVDQAITSAPTGPTLAVAEAPTDGAAMTTYVGPDPGLVSQRIISMVLDMTGSTDVVEQDTPFMDAGVDSLASVELRTNLQQNFGVPLPSTVMFNFPNAASITAFLVEEMTDRKIPLK